MKRLILITMLLAALSGAAFASPCVDVLAEQSDIVNNAGLYASVMIAQGVLETGHCTSGAVQYNNYWGIKCRGGSCFMKDTWEIYAGQYWQGPLMFQAFDSARDGVSAYAYKINYNPIYADVDTSSLPVYVATLSRHWATDPKYAGKVLKIIQDYNLQQYDVR